MTVERAARQGTDLGGGLTMWYATAMTPTIEEVRGAAEDRRWAGPKGRLVPNEKRR
jgi:hypothetical protein